VSDVEPVSPDTVTGASGHVVIVGCGRVGAGLAGRLLALGHTVAVIDTNRSAFRRLAGLDAEQIEGIGYDRVTLRNAGVERAVALAAVTNGDNSNIVVARTGREAFGVARVFARIYDMRRAAVYERLGIPTVASARLTIDMSTRQGVSGRTPGVACLDRHQPRRSRIRRHGPPCCRASSRCEHPADARPRGPGG
jgi:2-polyprenyl-6-methoxyphenol hydroxylase-like FAD-dependent oxidoreductase